MESFGVNSPNLKRNTTVDILAQFGSNLVKKVQRHQTLGDVKL